MTFSIFIPTTINTTTVAEMRREELIFHYLLGGSFDYWSDQLGVESSLEVWTEERRKLYHSFRYETGNIGMARRPGEIIVLLETWVLGHLLLLLSIAKVQYVRRAWAGCDSGTGEVM